MNFQSLLRTTAAALFTALFFACINAAHAQSCTPKSGATRIITINGVANPNIGDADMNASALKTALNAGNSASPVNVESFWSPGYGEGLNGTLFDLLAAAELTNRGRTALDFLTPIYVALNPEDILAISALRSTLAESQRPVINNLKVLLRSGVQNGQKFVLVPHSRGNLIVSTALNELRQEGGDVLSSIGVVGIASPDTQKAGENYLYISRSDDGVARLGSMPANFTAVNSSDIVSAHPFISAYLDPRFVDASGTSIATRVVTAINDMKTSVENCGVNFVLTPPSATIAVGEEFTFTAVATNVPGSSLRLLSRLQWNSARSDIASVRSTANAGETVTGTIHGESPADTTIIVTDEITGRVRTASVQVLPGAHLVLVPENASMTPGGTTQMSARLVDSAGNPTSGELNVTWDSTNKTVAEISPSGLVTALSAGTTTIVAVDSDRKVSTRTTITVTAGGLKSLQQEFWISDTGFIPCTQRCRYQKLQNIVFQCLTEVDCPTTVRMEYLISTYSWDGISFVSLPTRSESEVLTLRYGPYDPFKPPNWSTSRQYATEDVTGFYVSGNISDGSFVVGGIKGINLPTVANYSVVTYKIFDSAGNVLKEGIFGRRNVVAQETCPSSTYVDCLRLTYDDAIP